MKDEFYVIYFDEDFSYFSLYENKVLCDDAYTPHSDEIYDFVDLFDVKKEVDQDLLSLKEPIFFDGYCFRSIASFCSNDYKKDGFMYDKINQRIVYGLTSIYATFENGKYIDVVTGEVIPTAIIKHVKKVEDSCDFAIMADELSLVSKHLDIYSDKLDEYMFKFLTDYINKNIAFDLYNKLCLKKREEMFKNNNMSVIDNYDDVFVSEDSVKLESLGKIRQLIKEMRKSSE